MRFKPTPAQQFLYGLLQQQGYVTALNSPRRNMLVSARALAKAGLIELRERRHPAGNGWAAKRLIPDVPVEKRTDGYFVRGVMVLFTTGAGMEIRGVVLRVMEILPVNGPGGLAVEWQDVDTRAVHTHDIRTAALVHKPF